MWVGVSRGGTLLPAAPRASAILDACQSDAVCRLSLGAYPSLAEAERENIMADDFLTLPRPPCSPTSSLSP